MEKESERKRRVREVGGWVVVASHEGESGERGVGCWRCTDKKRSHFQGLVRASVCVCVCLFIMHLEISRDLIFFFLIGFNPLCYVID